ncbi:MAG: hypothetical protein PHO02_06395 [Candidatus Nanoarchaeia archaeon]|nr:hypothetical protein [Candidatus Nanoarchaeia archaeon]
MPLFNDRTWTPADQMNLYLAWKGLKPASIIDLYLGKEEDDRKINDEYIKKTEDKFSSLLEKRCICFEKEIDKAYGAALQNGKIIKEYSEVFLAYYIAKEKDNLENLVSAIKNKENGRINHKALGAALGYPKEAVDSFMTKKDEVLICGAYTQVELAKAKKAGVEIPRWLAYINYVVEEIDLINGKVSESSKALGEKYRKYIRKHNPRLAEKVENHFKRVALPVKWELRDDGFYAMDYGDYSFNIGS